MPASPRRTPPPALIRLRGVCQHNLRHLDLDLPLGELIVVTGVSGSGKSSLAFDTVYAEGQRRYVETFSPYARQFLDRMDRPCAARIEGIPPAIAIDQTNPVRTARSTVGTMTELNEHLKLLFARAARLYCQGCGRAVHRDRPEAIWATLLARTAAAAAPTRVLICFRVPVPAGLTPAALRAVLAQQGYVRILAETPAFLDVIQDRLRLDPARQGRAIEALETAMAQGQGRVTVYPLATDGTTLDPWRFSADLHCPDCDLSYRAPRPPLFSFNSPVGACPTCRGFGRTIGIDWSAVVPEPTRSLLDGAIRPLQSDGYAEVQEDLLGFAHRRGIPTAVPWQDLTAADRTWVMEGEGDWSGSGPPRVWYGLRRFFDWLESRSYKLHVRVLLARYRAYDRCPDCAGARLIDEALDWRLGDHDLADRALARAARFRHGRIRMDAVTWLGLPGLNLHDLMRLPIARLRAFCDGLQPTGAAAAATDLLLTTIRARLGYLTEVGLGYLTMDRQSRTLSGGEVQRINLTTALGTALVNTLFVLDEPSIGLHPRDIDRIVAILRRLRDQGNSLLVVEHDPQVIRAADRLLELGPGPGEHGGQLLGNGPPTALMADPASLTGAYLAGRRRVAEPRAPLAWDGNGPALRLQGARAHNLQELTVVIPLGRLVVVTGVSGSGKSTLVEDVLFRHLARAKGHPEGTPGACDALTGAELIADVVLLDQAPLGRSGRSNPASVVGALAPLRRLFAATPAAQAGGLGTGHFSFNSGPGRCPTCGGAGFELVEMQFLADVRLRCPDCHGRRFRPEVLAVRLGPAAAEVNGADATGAHPSTHIAPAAGLNIAEVLDLTAAAAAVRFADQPEIVRALTPLLEVGLDYLRLGQPVPTLSGGEAQRLKLAAQLAKSLGRRRRPGAGLLFLLDEPTTGLHFEDVARLLAALRRLLAAGHSLLVIEHNLDLIRAADWIIDLGPEGGAGGGRLVATGTPAAIAACAASHTGQALRASAAADDWPESAPAADTAATAGRAPLARADAAGEAPAGAPVAPLTQPATGLATGSATGSRTDAGLIAIRHAREHNLQDLSLDLPRDRLIVVTGVSGSGKSTLAFDILFAEGQRRYLESLNAYARQFVQPAVRADVDAVFGLPPTVAIEQRTSRGGARSTVGTLTEIHHYLRLLFVKLGTQYCPACQVPIEPRERGAIGAQLRANFPGQPLTLLAPLVIARKGRHQELAAWAADKGHAWLLVDGVPVPTTPWPDLDRYRDHHIDLPVGSVPAVAEAPVGLSAVGGPGAELGAELGAEPGADRTVGDDLLGRLLHRALDLGQGLVRVWPGLAADPGATPATDSGGRSRPGTPPTSEPAALRTYSSTRTCPSCGIGFEEPDPRLFSYNSKAGWCPACFGTGVRLPGFAAEDSGEEGAWLEASPAAATCPACQGARLRPAALAVRLRGHSIAAISALPVEAAGAFFAGLELSSREAAIGHEPLREISARLRFLQQVGLGYLGLDRGAPTLSGGEAQRIRLAAQLGSNLRGVCYVLDEPSIGLHPRDNGRLLDLLTELRDAGNSVIVVEHDVATMQRADEVIDLGPGAGQQGGRLVARGPAAALAADPTSVTGRCLAARRTVPPRPVRPVGPDDPALHLRGANLHNLQDLDLCIPLSRLVCVTGVSGSGKSTLVRDLIGGNLGRLLEAGHGAAAAPAAPATQPRGGRRPQRSPGTAPTTAATLGGCRGLSGWQGLGRVLEVDQSPIGKTPRSCPATYLGIWDRIRRLFAAAPEARIRGWGPGRFSFNTAGGRCPACEGQGVQRLAMSFLPEVTIPCEVCGGTRFEPETRAVQYLGLGIDEVLALSVDAAVERFAAHPAVQHPLTLLQDLGLGYLRLGQPSPTLSGGEAQRLKLVSELARARAPAGAAARPTLYLLDEPTVGLHLADVARLIAVLHRLVAAGHSLLIVEHDLDLIASADWIIDLGPEGGPGGGRLVAAGPPAAIAACLASHTGRFLGPLVERDRPNHRPSA